MKILLLILLLPMISLADSVGLDIGVGQNSTTFYGLDYELVFDLVYLNPSFFFNKDYVQPSLSTGLQFEHINLGFVGSYNGQVSFGPELGFTQNLTPNIYIKENNSFTSIPGHYLNFSASIGLGINL